NLEHGTYWTGFKNMVMLGIEHIREGTDHLLFLLVLMLPAADRIRRLIKIVTAFTIGHSISLLCGTLGWIVIPSQWVEVAITLTILISAIHAIRPIFPEKEAWIALDFGFIHGLAFAAALNNLDLVPTEIALSILGFNVGIEAMQLFVLLCTLPWLILIGNNWVRYIGGAIAIIASLGWMVERISNEPNIISAQLAQIQGKWFIIILAIIAITFSGTRWVRARLLS
uniref:HupE/UreJ family protein n=1 Tax=Chitinophaga sp. TaxID=1869181 RepID=UPI0031D5A970